MATKTQVIRKNIAELAETLFNEASYPLKQVKVKSVGNDQYELSYGSYNTTIEGADCFSGEAMQTLCENFLNSAADVNPKAAGAGSFRGGNASVYGEDNFDLVADDFLAKVDCRMTNYDDNTIKDFWSCDAENYIPERLREINADDHPLSVYHYKGKYWYVAPNIVNISYEVYALDEETREIEYESCEEVEVLCHVSEAAKKVAEEMAEFIKSTKDDLELNCVASKIEENVKALTSFLDSTQIKVVRSHVDGSQRNYEYELEELIHQDAFDYLFAHYRVTKEAKSWRTSGFFGEILEPDAETVMAFLKATYPDLKIVNQSKMEKFAAKLGFNWSFDFSEKTTHSNFSERTVVYGSIKFTNKENGLDHYHVSSEEFEECGNDWKTVFRDVIQPMVQRRAMQEIDLIIKTKLQGRIKEVAQHVWITFADSIKSGNCEFGSRQFTARNHINLNELGAIRGDALLELEDSDFTRRIILMKAANDPDVRKIVGI
jgi:hypothetical protein